MTNMCTEKKRSSSIKRTGMLTTNLNSTAVQFNKHKTVIKANLTLCSRIFVRRSYCHRVSCEVQTSFESKHHSILREAALTDCCVFLGRCYWWLRDAGSVHQLNSGPRAPLLSWFTLTQIGHFSSGGDSFLWQLRHIWKKKFGIRWNLLFLPHL